MKRIFHIMPLLLVMAACNNDIPTLDLGIAETYHVARMQKLSLDPSLTGTAYRWWLVGSDGRETLLADTRHYVFLARAEGTYHLRFEIVDDDTPLVYDFTVYVVHEQVEYSPYIAKVYEYRPAPGQFVNLMPRYEAGDDAAAMARKAQECIAGKKDVAVSLGGYGGYITFGFDHTVINVPGEYDLRFWGNAFYETADGDRRGGSAEPGIVMVSYDANCNRLPDDEWYELAGSAYRDPGTLHDYTLTYYRPDDRHTPVPGDYPYIIDNEYIRMTDSEGVTAYMPLNMYHTGHYWPQWIADGEMTFTGTRLPDNGVDKGDTGMNYLLYCFGEGYVDNHPNDYADLNSFNIEWAVDGAGNPVSLPGVDFVRVYTGVNQYCGWIGETSTELTRAADLHVTEVGSNR